MQPRHRDREQYFNESAATSAEYYMPFIEERCGGTFGPGFRVLEIGCGEGGNLCPFAQAGCEVVGVDIHLPRVEEARVFFAARGLRGDFTCANVFDYLPPEAPERKFDLVIMHDVIEHISAKKELMLHIKGFLKDDGAAFIAFPAWQMPFGGHQQMLSNKAVSRFPYIHLLPKRLYRYIMKAAGEAQGDIDWMMDIVATRMSVEAFGRLVADTGYAMAGKRHYLVNPHYKAKFGLKPRRLPRLIGGIPYLCNFFTTSFWAVIRKGEGF